MNNNKKTITTCSIIALIILAIIIIITLVTDLVGFSIILGVLFVILLVCLGIYMKEEPDEYSAYVKTKSKILRTYDSIIIEVEDIPNIAGKNIIKVKSIDDLVDAQLELREPIYYKNDSDSCFFLLLHYNEACIYILRMNDSVVSPTEQSIRFMREDKDAKKDESILEDLENTIVYRLDELRSFKISPVRNEKAIQVVDDTAIKEDIEEHKVSKEAIEEEMSKTMYINDLKEKIRQYESEAGELVIDQKPKTIKEITEKARQEAEAKTKEAERSSKTSKTTKASKNSKKAAPKKNTHSSRRATNYNKKK